MKYDLSVIIGKFEILRNLDVGTSVVRLLRYLNLSDEIYNVRSLNLKF